MAENLGGLALSIQRPETLGLSRGTGFFGERTEAMLVPDPDMQEVRQVGQRTVTIGFPLAMWIRSRTENGVIA
jgi:hypothetical protein